MENKTIVTGPVAIGPYSPAVKAGQFVFVSGQVPLDISTGRLIVGGIEDQVRQSLENTRAILAAAGSSLDNVVKVNIFIMDIDDLPQINKVYRASCKKGCRADFLTRGRI